MGRRSFNELAEKVLPQVDVIKRKTNVKPETLEPSWFALIPDHMGRSNRNARKMAKEYWDEIISELKENETYARDCLEPAKRLVLYRVRFDTMAIRYFQHGDVIFDTHLSKNIPNSACESMDRTGKMIAQLEILLGLNPYSRGKVQKRVARKERQGSSLAYLKPVPSKA